VKYGSVEILLLGTAHPETRPTSCSSKMHFMFRFFMRPELSFATCRDCLSFAPRRSLPRAYSVSFEIHGSCSSISSTISRFHFSSSLSSSSSILSLSSSFSFSSNSDEPSFSSEEALSSLLSDLEIVDLAVVSPESSARLSLSEQLARRGILLLL
jgi:hypothetical protein